MQKDESRCILVNVFLLHTDYLPEGNQHLLKRDWLNWKQKAEGFQPQNLVPRLHSDAELVNGYY